MAKRTDEKPFRPLDAELVRGVMFGNTAAVIEPANAAEQERTVELKVPVGDAGRESGASASKPAEPVRSQVRYEPPAVRRASRREGALSAASPLGGRMDKEKRVLLTPAEDRSFEQVIVNIAAELGTSLKASHVLRSCIRLIINAESEIIDRARATGRTIRPSNADLGAIEAFEKIVSNVLQSGIRNSRPVR